MAFRQPTHYAPQRTYTQPDESHLDTQPIQTNEHLEESQEWVIFSPAPASTIYGTHTTSTERTRQTAHRSRVSDYGSLETAARSYSYDEEGSEHTEAIVEDEDDGELDSLDSHLLDFHAQPSVYQDQAGEHLELGSLAVLPTHDGLGSFRVDRTVMGEGVQEQLYAFERYNPRRIKRRRESLELGQLELGDEMSAESEKTRRIEQWRLEQSRALLEEIQKETRRRRQSVSTGRRTHIYDNDEEEEEMATLGSVHDDESDKTEAASEESESFWTRITRRVIKDLMGIDDRLLSIIFGEALPSEDEMTKVYGDEAPSLEESSALIKDSRNDSWEYRLLERIARELGLLVNQLSDHPGAFSTYVRMQQTPLPYAGLPIIPEAAVDAVEETTESESAAPVFHPTIPRATQPIDISTSRISPFTDEDATPPVHEADDSHIGFTKEEWEKQLDIGMVFSYLCSRFSRTPTSAPTFLEHKRTPSTPQSAAARAARVQQHHPLVMSRPVVVERRASFRILAPASPKRRAESLKSGSTRRRSRGSGSSRPYWDIGGSCGSGSLLVAGGGGMGFWGDI
jgi:hypothetical protein